MQRKRNCTWKLLLLGAALVIAAAFTACKNPTGGGEDGGGSQGSTTYTVTFVRGSEPLIEEAFTKGYTGLKSGVKIEEPTKSPSKDGEEGEAWVFTGWFKDDTFQYDGTDDEWIFATDQVVKDTTLYARFMDSADANNKIEITFDLKNGSYTGSDATVNDGKARKTITKGERAKLGSDPTTAATLGANHEKFAFLYWYKDDDTEAFDLDTRLYEETTLNAKWQVPHKVTFAPKGGSAVAEQVIKHGEKAKEPTPAPTLEGNTLIGWFTKDGSTDSDWGDKWDFENDEVVKPITLFAQWASSKLTVTFNSDGAEPGSAELIVDYGKKLSELTIPTFIKKDENGDNRKIEAWYKERELTTVWGNEEPIIADMILFAKWAPPHEITFLTGKIGTEATITIFVQRGNVIPEDKVPTEDKIGASANLAKDKDAIVWINEATGTTWNLATDKVQRDMRLRPKWEFELNDTGPGGGKIFYAAEFTLYLDADDTTGVKAHYLELAPTNIPGNKAFYNGTAADGAVSGIYDIARTYEEIGYGRRNTYIILNTVVDIQKAEAAYYASVYDTSGTWFLPTVEEFRLLASQLHSYFGIPHATSDNYWLSNQGAPADYNKGILGAFNSTGTMNPLRNETLTKSAHVRPIRAW